jgi:DNA polymerase (family X)
MKPLDRKAIAHILDEMGTLLELQGANPFKSRAFHNASRALEAATGDIASMAREKTLTTIKGIGAGIAAVVSDLALKGSSADYNDLRNSFPDGVLDMLRIPGLGPKKVAVLFKTLKLKSLDDLEAAAKADELSSIEGFGKKTQENILAGIAAVRSRGDRQLYSVASTAAGPIFAVMSAQPGVKRASIAGSLRRHKEVIGDIDILLSAPDKDRERLMKIFVSHPDVESVVANGPTKSSVVLGAGINCDLRIVDDEEYPFALNYFTGSKEHNVALRARAKRFGWSLNEYGFSNADEDGTRGKAKKAVACKDEEAIYRALELDYIPPELREDRGEIPAAERHGLPTLVEWKDIRGTFHCHTTYSDGLHSLKEMAEAAKALGWEYLGIADHSPAAAYAGGLSAARLKEQFAEIDSLNAAEKSFRIFRGTECDILSDGSLDWPEKILGGFDYVVISVHSGFRMSEAAMTKRIIKALKNKHVTMLGHPTGRLLLEREPYPVNMTEVIDAAADFGKIIEINAHPMRLDLDWRLCSYAKEKGVAIAINPDAHTRDGLSDVRYGVGIARKGWLSAADVVNTRPLKRVPDLLKRVSNG